jgi:predicted DNA-binding transcriptional regulator YafY
MQVNRLFEIVYILLRHKIVTAKELAERLGVSRRTIYRDIDILSVAGIPVFSEKGKGGGIGLLPDFVLSKSMLSEQEQNEILSALQSLSHLKEAEANRVLHKLSAVFNKTAANWLEVDFTEWGFMNGLLFNDLKDAVIERWIIEFDYYGASGEKTRRSVEPVQLWFKSKTWYLKGYCLIRRDIRLFKLTRIKNLIVTDTRFTERDSSVIRDDVGQDSRNKEEVMLKFRIAPEMAYRVYDEFDEDCVEKQPDGGYIVTTSWPEDDWIYGMILSFGKSIEVLAPERIRDAVKNIMLEAIKIYL